MRRWVTLLIFTAAFGFPLVVLAVLSFTPSLSISAGRTGELSGREWNYLFSQNRRLVLSIFSSVSYSFCAVILSFLVSVLPARLFARYDFPGKTAAEALLLAPVLLPAITFSMGIHQLFIRLFLSDTFAGVVIILSFVSFPDMFRALGAGYSGFSEKYEQCALNLGAGWRRTFFSIELPFLLPSAAAGGAVVFLVCFSDYFLVFLIGGGTVPSFTGYLGPFITSSDFAVSSALALVFLAVPVMLFIIQEIILIAVFRKRGMEI